ncbi:TT30A-like protein [Mya arenaria]|uniref:Tetratricopeptide repeat protein 30 n=1 Tax=Mya arenaria TaxID=6604 RepID=A0ABY7DKM4_MYAAR|nr:TT30A-like protein [Mya arenaria]
MANIQIKEGEYTSTIYGMSRAALSLLGYCYYQMQDFVNASDCYEQLSMMHPEIEEYRLYYAQALYKACLYQEAMKVACQIDNPARQGEVIKLQAAIKYGEEDLPGAKSLVEQCPTDDPDTEINLGCLLFKEHRYEEACHKFTTAIQILGYKSDLSYNIALCHYMMKHVGMTTEGIDVRSVGNSLVLHETALALMNMDNDATQGFEKLQFLLQQNPFPPETFGNLLILYVKYEYYDLAADVLAENAHLTYKFLSTYLYDFLEAVITRQTSPEEAYRKLDEMATKQTETLRKLTKQVQEARTNHDDEAVKKAVNEYDEALERYIPILMQQAKIYWDMENYQQVEKIFRKSVEFCNEHDTWKLNVAHVLFMQENKYKEATGFYEPIVKKNYDNILNVSAIVLANLCVAYIMTSQNEEAEELMRKIEKEEEQVAYQDPEKKIYHLCIVNLVIGTLYCAKGNYEFGISRVIKSLEPYNKKLGTDTWYYAKRCFLSLIENMTKHMIMMRDAVMLECIQFLECCEMYGRDVKAMIEQPLEKEPMHPGKNTVTYEARLLKGLLLQLI